MKFITNLSKILILATLTTLLCHSSLAATKNKNNSSDGISGSQNLAASINQLINSTESNLNIGVAVRSMKTHELVYDRNDNRFFIPASILKIFTAEAALLYLGSDYKFQTNLYTDATSINNGILNGNIYLIHSGDPTLTYSDLLDLMSGLKAQQIQQINGNVYIDTTAYDQENYGPGWFWNDTHYCYGAPISASIINHNCLSFQISPNKKIGNLANIIESPRYFYSGIQNFVVTKSKSGSCYIHLSNNADSSISVTGCLPKGRFIQGVSTVISNVVEYNKSLVNSLLQKQNIQIKGVILTGAAPRNLQILVSHQSKPLYQLVSIMLKNSDNIIAGSLFKKLGEIYSKQPGSWENGSIAVSQILSQKAGVNTDNMNVLDGSGLSRFNKITPQQMIQLLDFAFHNYATNYEFISGLPVAGVDGTLKHRLYNVAWRMRAKTGTMKGVNALAGYIITRDKEPLAFVIIVNGKLGLGWKYKELEDRIVTAISRFTR